MNTIYKRAVAFVMMAVIAIGQSSCKKEKIEVPTIKVFEGAITLDYTSASVSAEVTDQGGAEVKSRGFAYGATGGAMDTIFCGSGTGVFSAELNNLQPNTSYVYEAFAKNIGGFGTSGKVTFTTRDYDLPTVKTAEIEEVGTTSAKCGGVVSDDGGAGVTERGVCWDTNHNPTASGNHISAGSGLGEFTCNMTNLSANMTYYVRAYAKNSKGIAYGEEKCFTTLDFDLPEVTTANVTDITQTSAKGGGEVTSDGGITVTERGICWNTNHNPTISGNHANSGSGTGNFTCNITGLNAHTTYYIRAYATNSRGTAYGEEVPFNTSANLPTVSTGSVINITTTSGTGSGNVTNDGGSTVTERGLCWSTHHEPTIISTHVAAGEGTGEFTAMMTNLTANTTYYVRAYATNGVGTSYGDEVEFCTLPISVPGVTTASVTNVGHTTATGGGNVISDGGATVTDRGICWSTNHNPTISDNHQSGGTGTGTFTVNMTGLSPNTTYYVRAYASNSIGRTYGEEVSFTTEAVGKPTVTTNSVSNITQTSATSGGNVTNDGGSTVTARGVCWSTSQNPTINNNHTSNGTGTGNFTSSLSGLTAGTTYYVRAYATNSAGTNYGTQKQFTTLNVTLPSVTTNSVTNITQTSATCGGNVTDAGGGTVTARGVCWSTSQNPTISNSHTSNGTGTGSFTSSITGLTQGTTYYIRAYATNSAGTAYGTQRSFTTSAPQAPSGAINGVFSVSASQRVYFSQGNLQYKASNGTWCFATNQYDYIGSANSNISSSYSGWIDLFGWGTSGWDCGNTYYRPWDSNKSNSTLYGPYGQYNLTGSYAHSDWGVHNAISNGGNQTWRTLTQSEWYYVFDQRNTPSGIRYAKAQVNGVNGVILLPDDWNTSYYSLSNYNWGGANYSNNMISLSSWENILEAHGAVFLPAAGYRYGTTVNDVGSDGYYWSVSYYSNNHAYEVGFGSVSLSAGNLHVGRCCGNSVRLVCPAQ